MSEKRIFTVGYIEYPETTLIYRSININAEDYPELKDKSDDEIIKYLKENVWDMKPINDNIYDSLAEELQDQDIIREKIPHVGSEFWVEKTSDDEDDNYEDDDYED